MIERTSEGVRQNLWGSEAVSRRGATFLPQLGSAACRSAPEGVEAFFGGGGSLLANMDGICADSGRSPECPLPDYLDNVPRAAE